MNKGPGRPDDIPRDAAGESYYDRVRNVNAQLEGMETDFLRVLAEHQEENGPDREPVLATEPTDPTMPPEPTVQQIVRVDKEGFDHLLRCWIQYTGTGDHVALYHLFTDMVNPVLRGLSELAAEAGWLEENNKEEQ